MSALHAIARAAGGETCGAQARIPGPGHSKHDRSLSLTLGEHGQILWHSFAGDTWASVGPYLAELGADLGGKCRDRSEIDAERARQREAKALALCEKRAIARALWGDAVDIRGSLAECYLARSRGIVRIPAGVHLRFHPRAPFTPYKPDSRRWPSLVGAITDPQGAFIGAHITFLAKDGSRKAAIDPSRKVIGSQKGGAIRLGEPADNVVVAEGIETALSASVRCRLPAAAAISAGNLARYAPPAGVCGVLIAFDRDAHGVGERDARALRARLRRDGIDAVLLPPPAGFSDWNEPDQEART